MTFGTTAPKSPDSGELKVSDVPEASDMSSGSSWFTRSMLGTNETNSSGETSGTRLSPVT